ncbi:MAG: voltage-gated potassium channel [Clostridiales bacterium]|nr:voltage-gated potassium channel [Clostridiales bacterium]MDN5282687.1 voltage-gated potassium channel [Candidatus Ozemobacter sp.]
MSAKDFSPLQKRLHEIIYESDTRAGKIFDLALIVCILLSAAVIMLDSVKSYKLAWGDELFYADWIFTFLFTIEYFLRIYCVGKAKGYIFSFYGLVDLFSILPSYLSLLFPGTQYLAILRIFRTLRIFRILKLAQYMDEADLLAGALKASRKRIAVFIFGVLLAVVFIGSAIYIIEGEENGFTSIPLSIYWAVVTLTTVGYGDVSPKTPLGQALSVIIMIMGYGIIAIPTGIVTSEIISGEGKPISNQACPECSLEGHDADARYCKHCGSEL